MFKDGGPTKCVRFKRFVDRKESHERERDAVRTAYRTASQARGSAVIPQRRTTNTWGEAERGPTSRLHSTEQRTFFTQHCPPSLPHPSSVFHRCGALEKNPKAHHRDEAAAAAAETEAGLPSYFSRELRSTRASGGRGEALHLQQGSPPGPAGRHQRRIVTRALHYLPPRSPRS
jgi:hypothetical protein